VGILYGRFDLLDELMAYKVRPAPDDPPGKFETGTQNHEGIAGVLGAVEYLVWVGTTFGKAFEDQYGGRHKNRRLILMLAMAAIHAYENLISRTLLDILKKTHGVKIYGLIDEERLEDRVPTYSFTVQGFHPQEIVKRLAQEEIYVWDGNYYALAVTEYLGLEKNGGMVRVGPVHYNTLDEIHLFGDKLNQIINQ
jgi:selenocysteine lyase/cysteine desulfurase